MHLPFHPWDLSRHDWALPSWLKTGESSGKQRSARARASARHRPALLFFSFTYLSSSYLAQ